MPHRFAYQPHADGGSSLNDFVGELATDLDLTHLDLVVAWVKRSGISPISDRLRQLVDRGVQLRAIVGISQGGTSLQGLQAIADLATEAYVFHQPGRTFHPKLFAGWGASHGRVLVGSHNLTLGGLVNNHEAGVVSVLDLDDAADNAYMTAVRGYVDLLLSDVELCIRLDRSLLQRLQGNSRYPLGDEDEFAKGEGADNREGPREPRLFGTTRFQMRSQSTTALTRRREAPTGPGSEATGPGPSPTTDGQSSAVLRRWGKPFPPSDAQILDGSNPTNTLTLVRSDLDVPAGPYFRHVFFGPARWSSTRSASGKPREVTSVEFSVHVDGANIGTFIFDIRYTPGYESNQGNRLAEFRWNDFAHYLREHPQRNKHITLERGPGNHYALYIEKESRGPSF